MLYKLTTLSELQFLDLHAARYTTLDRHAIFIFNGTTPFMYVPAFASHGITKGGCLSLAVSRALAARVSTISFGTGFLLELEELLLELGFFSALLVGFATLKLSIESLGRSPLCLDGVLFHLEAEEQHHVVPVRLVGIWLREMGKELGVLELGWGVLVAVSNEDDKKMPRQCE